MKQQLYGRFWTSIDGKNFAGTGRIELLKRIKTSGSISKAAKEIGMSYKAAWDNINAMNELADKPLIITSSGGKNGGGSKITDEAEQFIMQYEKHTNTFFKVLEFMEQNPDHNDIITKLKFSTSADNTFYGKIISIEKGTVSCIVEIEISGADIIVANITNLSFERMNLKIRENIYAIIDAKQIILIKNIENTSISARNRFDGIVINVQKGAVNSEVGIKLAGGSVLKTIITNDSLINMNIDIGDKLSAVCKASNIIVIN